MDKTYTKNEAREVLGIPLEKFESLNLPYRTTNNPHWASKNMYLYSKTEIDKLALSPIILQLKAREKSNINYPLLFEEKYKNYVGALPVCCDCLFNLNRYAKNNKCSNKNKNEIYQIKADFIKYLYQEGHCTEIKECNQKKIIPEKECYHCLGTGCERCDDTGIFEEKRIYEQIFYSFSCKVDDKTYSWHLPANSICYNIDLTSDECEKMPHIERNKPVDLHQNKRKEAKELIKWFLKKENHIKSSNNL